MDKDKLREQFYNLIDAQRHITRAVNALEAAGFMYTAERLEHWLYEGEGEEVIAAQERIEDALEGETR